MHTTFPTNPATSLKIAEIASAVLHHTNEGLFMMTCKDAISEGKIKPTIRMLQDQCKSAPNGMYAMLGKELFGKIISLSNEVNTKQC